MNGSLAGFQSALSIPLMIPTKRSRIATKASCNPKPPFSVRSSCACVGLTVVTASAQAMPPFSMFILPYHSNM